MSDGSTSVPPQAGGVHAVIVAYGPAARLKDALDDLGDACPVTVVDNGSDGEVERLARQHGARYLDPGANLGFAAGVNRALSGLSLPDVDVLLLNPDARIVPATLARLRQALEADPTLACVAPAQRPSDSAAESPACWPWHTPARAWAEALRLARRRPRRVFLSGAVLLLRGAALAEVGGFDERFFLYAEDEDWQRRAIAAGWRIRLCPDVAAVHSPGGTDDDLGRQQLRLHAATERHVRKWHGTAGWTSYRSAVVVGQLLRAATRRGWRRRAALRLVGLYLAGPDRRAMDTGVVPPPGAAHGD